MNFKNLFLSLLFIIMGVTISNAQVSHVEGEVLDALGEPIIGASVVVKGSTPPIGTVTDIDGKFTLKSLSKNAKELTISFIGMQTVDVAIAPKIKVTLHDEQQVMDEVIVVAFGEQKKSSFTGSATVLNVEKLEQKQVSNVMQALVGEVPGLEMAPSTSPGSTQSITIRGEGSINAGTEPLIIVDGMPYEAGWNNINPADVESMTVLKDAASNALYGARGANGVIMITTKRGKAGKAIVTLDAKYGVNSRFSQDYDRITEPGQYYELYYKALYNNYISGGMSPVDAYHKANKNLCGSSAVGGLVYNVYSVPDNEYLIGSNGRLNPNASLGNRVYYNGNYYTLMPDDWTDATYKNGARQEYNVNISGGNEKAQVYGAFGYLNDEGIVEASNYERYSARLKASYKAKEWMNFGGNVNYVHSVSDEVGYNTGYTSGSIFSDAANVAPIYPLYLRDGDGNIMYNEYGKMYDFGGGTGIGHGLARPIAINLNDIKELEMNTNEYNSNSFNGDAFVDITFLQDFKFTFKTGTSLWEGRQTTTYNPYYGYNATQNGILYKYQDRSTTLNMQQLLNWNHTYADKHNLSALMGHESYRYRYEYIGANKTGAVDYWNNQELDGWLTTTGTPSSYASDYNTEGYFFRGMYNYDERYFASASFRRDASSRFHPNNRWGNFWSLGGAWIINKEDWFHSDVVNSLKMKVSYGQQGNDQIGSYRYTDTYNINAVDGNLSLSFAEKGNKEITWESNANFNAGFEFELYKGRLSGSIEYYNRLTGDMLMRFSVPSSLGYSSYYKNVGDLCNQGIEATLNGVLYRNKKVEWRANLNLTYNHNEVTKLASANKPQTAHEFGNGKIYGGYQSGNYFIGEGLPLDSWYLPKYAGVNEEGLSQWYTTDSEGNTTTTTAYSNATYYVINSQRPIYGGLGTSLTGYGFDLSVQFTYSLGGKGYDWEYAQLMSNPSEGLTGFALHKDILKAWSSDNTSSDIPRWQYNDMYTSSFSDRFLIDNSYFNLQNVQLGYTVSSSLVKKLNMEKVRFYITGDNLYLWSKRKGYDPRLSSGYGSYSPMRTISAGVNIQF